jgi:hypothetical protein
VKAIATRANKTKRATKVTARRRAVRNPLADEKATPRKETVKQYAIELAALYKEHGTLDPAVVVEWAKDHPESALHGRFTWDDSKAAHEYRLWQARQLITVEVTYESGKKRQVYVSPIIQRGNGGYSLLVEVLSDKERREQFLAQALADYNRVGEKYSELVELAEVRAAVERATLARRK